MLLLDIYPDIWLRHPVKTRQAELGPPTDPLWPVISLSLSIAPPPCVGWFLRTWAGVAQKLSHSALAGVFSLREREWRQNDGDSIPDGDRHVLATNGRDVKEHWGSLCLLFYSAGVTRRVM